MSKIGFAGFGEVNTPVEIIVNKCTAARDALQAEGLDLLPVFPITDDYEEKDIAHAVEVLKSEPIDALVLCIAGWIPTHAVIKVAEHFRHLPVVLWGLCGWVEDDGRLVTTADQAGTTALRGTLAELGYRFTYIYDIVGQPCGAKKVADYCAAAKASAWLRHSRAGMMGYRDMNLYGTLYDGSSLKRVVGAELETFEMLEIEQRYQKLSDAEKMDVVNGRIRQWKFLAEADESAMMKAAGYYLAVRELACERGYTAISLKDVDGMKKLLGYPPAPIFMLLAEDGFCVVPENDSLGCVTQMMLKALTGQCAAYLEFYEFFTDRVLAGVPDFVPEEIVEGEVTVMPAAFGELSQGILNVSKVKPGELTMCRLFYTNGQYKLHMVKGEGITPRRWEEAGWAQPAPQLPGLEVLLADVEDFADKVAAQHYFIVYGDYTRRIKHLCDLMGIEII